MVWLHIVVDDTANDAVGAVQFCTITTCCDELVPSEFVATIVIVYVPGVVIAIVGLAAVELEMKVPTEGLMDQLKVGAGVPVVELVGVTDTPGEL